MLKDITSKFKSQPICRNCGADVRVEYSPWLGYYSKCEKCGSDCAASPFSSDREEQDWLYRMFCSNFKLGRSETPLKPKRKELKVFLSGPMTGYENFNFKKFDVVADRLSKAGVDVVNPTAICRKYKKEKVLADKSVFDAMIAEQQEAEKTCTGILLLDGWEASKGVRLELKTALDNGADVFLEKDVDMLVEKAKHPGARFAYALSRIYDEDWKTQSARGYSDIPAGSRVLVLRENVKNLYGSWIQVFWNGNTYYTSAKSVSTPS